MSAKIAGLVLAGGLSRRMGGAEKGLQLLAGQSMISRVIERFAPQVDRLAINANSEAEPYLHFGLPVLPDTIGGHLGPLAGILTGLEWAATLPGVSHVATAATDTPFLPLDLVARLAALARPDGIVLARSNGNRHPVFGLWPVALRQDLTQWLRTSDTMKVSAWANRHDLAYCDFDAAGEGALDPFFNANTPEELAEAERHLAEAGA